MSSRFADLYQDSAIPVLTEQLGEDVVRYPLGDLSSPVTVSGIWVEEDPHDSTERGHENVRKVCLTLLDGTVPDTRDIYALPGDWTLPADVAVTSPPKPWTTRSISRGTEPATVAYLEYRELEIRNGKGGRVL